MGFTKRPKISSFTMELCRIMKELYSLTDQELIESIAMSHILSTINGFMREDGRICRRRIQQRPTFFALGVSEQFSPFTFSGGIDFVANMYYIEEFCDGFFEDLIVFSNPLSEHLDHLHVVDKKLSEFGLHVNYSKCQFVWDM